MAAAAVRLAGRRRPVVLPRPADPRLHTAAVVMTIHVLGQVAFGFAVSVWQIFAAIGTAAVIDLAVAAVRTGGFVWPASGMLTGSGVALILRVDGTTAGQHWSTHGWWLFAAVAALSLATKHLVRWRGAQVFNPSNIGLVAAFLLLGSGRVEPLDLWWHPLGPAMVLAYGVIAVGGLMITSRLRLLGLVLACWLSLLAGLGVLSASGHCMTAPWSPQPVCGAHFWWTFAISPEILVFVLFMTTDPKTVPATRRRRVAFGVAVGLVATLLIAPQSTEFGAKVALLGALTIVTVARLVPAGVPRLGRAVGAGVERAARWSSASASDVRGAMVGFAVPIGMLVFASSVVVAGAPARRSVVAPVRVEALPPLETILEWQPPAQLPAISADPAVATFGADHLAPDGQRAVAVAVLRGLATEAEVLRRREGWLLAAVDHGARLDELTARIEAADGAPIEVRDYRFDELHLLVVRRGGQSGPLLGVLARGTARITMERPDRNPEAARLQPADLVVALRPATDGRWMIADVDEHGP